MASSASKTITPRLPGGAPSSPHDEALRGARPVGDGAGDLLRTILAPFASLKLTVALFAMSIVIVFAGSVAQIDAGIWTVVHDYFRTAFAYIPLRIFFPRSWHNVPQWGFYFPGGWLIGALLLTNLLAAHAIRFTVKARGAKLIIGTLIVILGMLVTWSVITDRVQEFLEKIAQFPYWRVVGRAALGGLAAGLLYVAGVLMFRRSIRTNIVTRRLAGLITLGLGLLLSWMVVTNDVKSWFDWLASFEITSRGDAFWRVLWRLLQGGIAAAILYAGCIPLFGKRAGIVVLHGGVILLLCSELITGLLAVESHMTLAVGETTNFIDCARTTELAIIDSSNPDRDTVTTVPESKLRDALKKHETISHPDLPFGIEVVEVMENSGGPIPVSEVGGPMRAMVKATAGEGKAYVLRPERRVTGVEAGREDATAFLINLKDTKSGKSLGTYIFSLWFYPNFSGRQVTEVVERVTAGGKTVDVQLRPERLFVASAAGREPFSIQLLKFNHEKYVGTREASDYSSVVQIKDPGRKVDRQVTISMNNPLRYAGRTFYQSGVLPGDVGTILQVVENVGWMVPYVSCMIVAIGLAGHLGGYLLEFLRKRAAA